MKYERGFTLVELMIALVISCIVMTAVYITYKSQHKSYIVQDQTVTMQQNLRAATYFLQKGIRMAGFDPNGTIGSTITVAGSNTISFSRQFTEAFRDLDGSGDQNGTEPFVDYNGNGNWDSDEFDIQYLLVDSDGDGVDDTLASNAGGVDMWISQNIQALGFAYAFDRNPRDGELDMSGGSTIWAIDTNGDGTLDLNLDTNHDGSIDAADDTDGDGIIDGAAANADLEDIRAVRIWLLATARREVNDFFNDTAYAVSNRIIIPNDGIRRELITMDVKCRNMGL